jgi:hypothetical protein
MLVNAMIIIVSIFAHLHPIVIVGVIASIIGGSGILFKNLVREHKAGNPNYLSGLSVKAATPKKVVDRNRTFNFIMRNK